MVDSRKNLVQKRRDLLETEVQKISKTCFEQNVLVCQRLNRLGECVAQLQNLKMHIDEDKLLNCAQTLPISFQPGVLSNPDVYFGKLCGKKITECPSEDDEEDEDGYSIIPPDASPNSPPVPPRNKKSQKKRKAPPRPVSAAPPAHNLEECRLEEREVTSLCSLGEQETAVKTNANCLPAASGISPRTQSVHDVHQPDGSKQHHV